MTGFISLDWFRRRCGWCSFTVGSNTEETHCTITRQVFGRDEVGSIYTWDPNALSRVFVAA
jgi:hypothetical protein